MDIFCLDLESICKPSRHSDIGLYDYRAQGAMVASVKPEYLLDAKDYQCWQRIQQRVMTQEDSSGAAVQRTGAKDKRKEAIKYEMLSGRAWTDLLAQLVKV